MGKTPEVIECSRFPGTATGPRAPAAPRQPSSDGDCCAAPGSRGHPSAPFPPRYLPSETCPGGTRGRHPASTPTPTRRRRAPASLPLRPPVWQWGCPGTPRPGGCWQRSSETRGRSCQPHPLTSPALASPWAKNPTASPPLLRKGDVAGARSCSASLPLDTRSGCLSTRDTGATRRCQMWSVAGGGVMRAAASGNDCCRLRFELRLQKQNLAPAKRNRREGGRREAPHPRAAHTSCRCCQQKYQGCKTRPLPHRARREQRLRA